MKKILLTYIFFASVLITAQTTFGNQNIIKQVETIRPESVFAIDIDGDGDMDVLSASSADDKIAWYENIDGNGTFGSQQIITSSADKANFVYATDIDGDGDMDVLSASSADDKIAWYENIDGNGTFGSQQIIATSADGASSVYATDIDGDGDMDVLSASFLDDKIAWYENTDGNGTFGSQQIIATSTDIGGIRSIYTTDIDDDGDMDVFFTAYDKIAWYKNTDGNGTFGSQQIIATSTGRTESIYAADIDGDNDMDVLSTSNDNKIVWYENIDGNGIFGSQQIITSSANGASSVYATDIDGDGDVDVISTSLYDNKIAWYENTDGNGIFGSQQIITSSADYTYSVYAVDIDGDGDMDVLSASNDRIALYKNIDSNGTFGSQQIISTDGAHQVYAADIDDDGDMDVFSGSVWYENTDGEGTFGDQQIIDTSSGRISIYATDIDSDGDIDVLLFLVDKIAWYENTDGEGTFGSQQIITTTSIDEISSVYATDIDGDGDMDVLSTSFFGDKIAWYENTDGNGTFGSQQIITTNADFPSSVYTADIDGDGDMDVLSALSNKITWYENIDGNGTFGSQQIITTSIFEAYSVYASDLDGDGDIDVLSASIDKIAWYENTDGNGIFGGQQIITTNIEFGRSVYATDIDGDGDIDVLSASRDDRKIAWYENLGAINLAVNENTLLNFYVYPTPTKNILSIKSKTKILKIEIYNILKQLILINKTENNIDISNLINGLYFVKVEDVNGDFGVKKIIKK